MRLYVRTMNGADEGVMTRKTITVMLEKAGSAVEFAVAIENVLREVPGVLRANVNRATEAAYIEYDADRCGEADLYSAVASAGLRTRPTTRRQLP
jgi:copper chaperone CopZ